jgi:hypothetical protein
MGCVGLHHSLYCYARITLAITWPQVVKAEVFCLAEAAQVNGGVREWQECQVQQEVTTAQSVTIAMTSEEARSMNFTFLERQSRLLS